MTDKKSHNCIVCADEFISSDDELHSEALSKINTNSVYKVCSNCLTMSDPAEDYKEVRNIVQSYLDSSSRLLFGDVQAILNSSKK